MWREGRDRGNESDMEGEQGKQRRIGTEGRNRENDMEGGRRREREKEGM